MVRVVRLERTVSWSQTRRDTNFAIPGYSFFCHDTTASDENKDFSVCGHLCGQSRFYAIFGNRWKSRKRRCCKALRRFASPYPGYNHGTPKAGALPAALHPDMYFSVRQHAFAHICTHANLKEQRRFLPRPHSAIPLSGGVRFLTAQAANLYILQFA